jgi:hypothetical protein
MTTIKTILQFLIAPKYKPKLSSRRPPGRSSYFSNYTYSFSYNILDFTGTTLPTASSASFITSSGTKILFRRIFVTPPFFTKIIDTKIIVYSKMVVMEVLPLSQT